MRLIGRFNEVAEILQIPHKLDNKATELSGGEMQRVSIGRALVRDPQIFLMDEPLSSLDAKLRADLRVELKRIQADSGFDAALCDARSGRSHDNGDAYRCFGKRQTGAVRNTLATYMKIPAAFMLPAGWVCRGSTSCRPSCSEAITKARRLGYVPENIVEGEGTEAQCYTCRTFGRSNAIAPGPKRSLGCDPD